MSGPLALSWNPGRRARVEGLVAPMPPGVTRKAPTLVGFEEERRRLQRLAYKLLGSSADAEDILQEAGIRWLRLGRNREEISNPGAFLAKLVTRLCLDVLRSSHSRRMRYTGSVLPFEMRGGETDEPAQEPTGLHHLMDDLAQAFSVLMERLNPVERAVLLLREAFDFSYVEIAGIVGKSIQNSRQIERRARQRVRYRRGRLWHVDGARRTRLMETFLRATQHGELEGFIATLVEDLGAGATPVPKLPRPVVG